MASGLCRATIIACFRLGFPPAPGLPSLSLAARHNSQAHSTKGTPSPHRCGSDLLRVHGFRFSFTPLAGVLFAFPSRYCCAIGRIPYLALDRGRPGFRRGFPCPAVLRMPLPDARHVGYGAFTPSGRLSQNRSPMMRAQTSRSCNPALAGGLGSSGFARRYCRNLC